MPASRLTREEAVFKIEKAMINYKIRKEGKDIRSYLSKIPYECRRSYVKMYDLKFKTNKLKSDVQTLVNKQDGGGSMNDSTGFRSPF